MTQLKSPPERFTRGWLDRLDGRYTAAQELKERFAAYTADLGGVEGLSYAQRSLVERFLWLEYWLAHQEKALAVGGDFDAGKWVQGMNSLMGLAKTLGLERRARDVPDLAEFIAAQQEAG